MLIRKHELWNFLILLSCLLLGLPRVSHALYKREVRVERVESAPKPVCQTPECIHAASRILKNMDTTVDPCNDFYRFSCGNFIKNTIIPEYQIRVGSFSQIDDQLIHKLRTTLEKPMNETDPRPFRLLKTYYQTCMNTTQINKNSERELKDIIKKLGGWPVLLGDKWDESNWDWKKTLFKFHKQGFATSQLINVYMQLDWRNNSRYVIKIDQARTGLSQKHLLKGLDDKSVQSYFKMMTDMAVYFGAEPSEAKKELLQVINLEMLLANISLPSEQLRNYSMLYNPMTLMELAEKYPYISWLDYINPFFEPYVKLSNDSVIHVAVPNYFENLNTVLTNTSNRVMSNYFTWRLIKESLEQMSDQIRDVAQEYNTQLYGTTVKTPRWKECVKEVRSSLNLITSALYVRNYFNENSKKTAVEMIERIKASFELLIKEITWMDKDTKKAALDKLANVALQIAYPDELKDDEKLNDFYRDLEIVPASYLKSQLNIKLFNKNHPLRKYYKPINKTDWVINGNSVTVNAYYSTQLNTIKIPASILQGTFFSHEVPKYMNYGGIGCVMGHEMTHGFDDKGRQFDKDGNLIDWWGKKTADSYLNKAKCIIDQYSNYTVRDVNMSINGVITQGENIADNGGVKEAYMAYNTWEKENGVEPALPGLPYTSQQMFWLSAANTWCVRERSEYLRTSVLIEPHAPNEFRVRGPFSNMPEFSKDFNCPSGSLMNPIKKCTVW